MVKIRSVNLETVCGITSTFPENKKIEVAFAGKSNVGKSSLINTLICRKSYAHTSSQPGKTQTVNYYHINEGISGKETQGADAFAPEVYFVDLPGYGYAAAAVAVKEKWGKMIERYLKTSKMLRTVFLLVDIRHTPSENDRMMHDWVLENGMEPVIIATKKDKLKRSQVPKALNVIRTELKVRAETPVIAFSAETREGSDEIWDVIRKLQ
ncbi:MAG TPA: ribosome biogenesis GTP-binding protein YihA/YsxC [Lachnospiraceae bacterium]|nr:ribosome biogenesis GTP-binding protein YihA/YsxC [Lachnospiraceae bacterium]